ncbi:MAG: ASPIC/UnbV domain-containing protein [Ferruginibacter sp.]
MYYLNVSPVWGISKPSNSNGVACADLDNDRDLDLVINNTNQAAGILRNDANKITGNNYLLFKLRVEKKNMQATGARIFVYAEGIMQTVEQLSSQGYQSSVSPILRVGLGKAKKIGSRRIIWPSSKKQFLKNVGITQFCS